MDETWNHNYTPESKEQAKQWTEAGCSAPKKTRSVPSAAKVMAFVFWDAEGILFIELLLWMRLRITITHQNPKSSQNSGQKPVVQRQRRQVRFHQQESSWHRYFGIPKAFCLLIILKRLKP
jgi:hypothetical protein